MTCRPAGSLIRPIKTPNKIKLKKLFKKTKKPPRKQKGKKGALEIRLSGVPPIMPINTANKIKYKNLKKQTRQNRSS